MKEIFNSKAFGSSAAVFIGSTLSFAAMIAIADGPLLLSPFLGAACTVPFFAGYCCRLFEEKDREAAAANASDSSSRAAEPQPPAQP